MAESSPTPPYRQGRGSSTYVRPLFSDQPDVLCDVCEEKKLEALKSCLMCQRSFCETHLEPHLRDAGLIKHKLMNPVNNLEDYICKEHKRPLELFCKDDQAVMCLECAVNDHMFHDTVSIEEMIEQNKTQQKNHEQMINDRVKKIEDIKQSGEVRKKNAEKEKANHVELFTDLIRSIERCKTEVQEMIEERQKAAEKHDQELIKDLEQEVTDLKMRNTKLKQLSHTKDPLHLLKINSSLCSPTDTSNWSEISAKTHQSQEPLSRALTELQNNLKETLHEKFTQTELKWKQEYAVDVTLDPDTAHPKLFLSDDGKQVRCGNIEQKLPDNSKRFDACPCVLGKEGFSSGRFYFEVKLNEKTEWTLGVARESTERKRKITLNPEDGYWTVILRNRNEYWACADPFTSLHLELKLQRIGVFVDYEEGLVSFYDVDSSSHIYSFTDQSFTGKLYPYFSPGSNYGNHNSAPLIIKPVSYCQASPEGTPV